MSNKRPLCMSSITHKVFAEALASGLSDLCTFSEVVGSALHGGCMGKPGGECYTTEVLLGHWMLKAWLWNLWNQILELS